MICTKFRRCTSARCTDRSGLTELAEVVSLPHQIAGQLSKSILNSSPLPVYLDRFSSMRPLQSKLAQQPRLDTRIALQTKLKSQVFLGAALDFATTFFGRSLASMLLATEPRISYQSNRSCAAFLSFAHPLALSCKRRVSRGEAEGSPAPL